MTRRCCAEEGGGGFALCFGVGGCCCAVGECGNCRGVGVRVDELVAELGEGVVGREGLLELGGLGGFGECGEGGAVDVGEVCEGEGGVGEVVEKGVGIGDRRSGIGGEEEVFESLASASDGGGRGASADG